jgi:hypothetical protein
MNSIIEIIISNWVFGVGFCFFGILTIDGTRKDLKALVDPLEELWWYWPPSLAKKLGDSEDAKAASYLLGIIWTCMGLFWLWEAVGDLLN